MSANTQHRKFMEIAVEEMRKSRSEHTHKHDPVVGAVLVSSKGKLLATTHRGGLRVGDHAEFTLIERHLRDKNLEMATLYVTLEPCVRRNPPKKPCAEWIVKARIRRAFIGMTDPNPDICGRGIQHLLSHGVEVDFFDLDLVRQIMEANRDFTAYYETPERSAVGKAEPFEGPSRQELEVVERSTLKDFSHDMLSRYLTRYGKDLRVPSDELWKIMERSGYVGRTAEGKLAPTVAGLVLFASTPAEILPQCRVSIEAKRAGRTISGDFEGPLIAFRDHLEKFFGEQMRHFMEIRGLDRVRVGEYPMEAIREAAFNAVIHRDYRPGARVHIALKETEIEVRSPGGLLKPLSLSRVRAFNAPPYSRNPHIAAVVQRMGWIEEKGSGLAHMRDAMMASGLRSPVFDLVDGYFTVMLPGTERAWTTVRVTPEVLAKLKPHEQKILGLVMAQGRLATKECSTKLGVGAATARRHLRQLVEKGFLKSSGAGSSITYYLSGSD